MMIADEFYSNPNDNEIQNRIDLPGKESQSNNDDQEAVDLLKEFLTCKQKNKSM
jgi:hypothetical protein